MSELFAVEHYENGKKVETVCHKNYIETTEYMRLGMKVRHEDIYHGKEVMTIVGIRAEEFELEGDYSGGMHNVTQKSWMPVKGSFFLRRICENHAEGSPCPLHNIQCKFPYCEELYDGYPKEN